MPITGVASWLPTMDEFLQHWQDVNTALAPGALTLSGAYARANLVTDRAAVDAAVTEVQTRLNVEQTARGERDVRRASVRPRFAQFRAAINAQLPGSRYQRAIPRTPPFTASPGKWRDALDDMSSLWTTVNTNSPPVSGFTPPLLLAGAYTLILFTGESNLLKSSFVALASAEQVAQLSREQRDAVFAPVYQRLKQYRQAVLASFPSTSPFVSSLPKLTAARGHTPAPVNASATWDVALGKARVTYTASTDPNLDQYELRACFGDRWKADESVVIDNNPPGALQFLTDEGLVAPGSRVFYKVFVVLTTSNERGSNTVSVTRP